MAHGCFLVVGRKLCNPSGICTASRQASQVGPLEVLPKIFIDASSECRGAPGFRLLGGSMGRHQGLKSELK